MSNKQQTLRQIELPQCQICHLEPIPESSQNYFFIVLEVMTVFFSIKLAICVVLLSFCFSKNMWFCPQCKRQIQVIHEIPGVSQNVIIRMGNCMFVLSKIKFRIISSIIMVYLVYLIALDVKSRPKSDIEKTWKSLATNCGYEAYMENQFKANQLYQEYPQLGQWNISGIFLRQQQNEKLKVTKLYYKMNPTQFKNPLSEDVVVIATSHTLINLQDKQKMEIGDVHSVVGQWEGRTNQGHMLQFQATRITAIGTRFSPTDVKLLSVAQNFIRIHQQQQRRTKEEHDAEVNKKIANLTNS